MELAMARLDGRTLRAHVCELCVQVNEIEYGGAGSGHWHLSGVPSA